MAQFDPSKMKILWEESTGNEPGDLIFQVFQYNKGNPKLKFSKLYRDRNTDQIKPGPCKNLAWEDLMVLEKHFEKIKEVMDNV